MRHNLREVLLLLVCTFMLAACVDSHRQTLTDTQVKSMVATINTDVDPQFVYNYEMTKFVPPDGSTLLMMGQTVEGITEYLQYFPDQPTPAGWAGYWAVTEFNGVRKPYRNVTGSTQHHQMLIDRFPNTVHHSAMWMVGKWLIAKRAGDGEFDEVIKQYGRWAKGIDRPIYLRIGYEFDGPHNALDPEEYVKAYRHIVDILRAENVTNIAYVWHSYASPRYKGHELAQWYPGDDYVDWVGISVFGHAYSNAELGAEGDAVLAFARDHSKPVMIAETSPVYGIDRVDTKVWGDWSVNFFSIIYNKNIKAVSFINEDWDRLVIPGIEEWGDARLYNNPDIARAWFEETNKERYLKQSAGLFQQLGYSPAR